MKPTSCLSILLLIVITSSKAQYTQFSIERPSINSEIPKGKPIEWGNDKVRVRQTYNVIELQVEITWK